MKIFIILSQNKAIFCERQQGKENIEKITTLLFMMQFLFLVLSKNPGENSE